VLTELGSGQLALGNIEQVRLKTRNQVLVKIKDHSSLVAANRSAGIPWPVATFWCFVPKSSTTNR